MSDSNNLHDEVVALAALYLDDELSPAEFERLSALLGSTPEAAAVFNDHCLHARTLRQSLGGRALIEPDVPATTTASTPNPPVRTASAVRTQRLKIPTPGNTYVYATAALVAIATVIVGLYIYASSLPQSELPDPTSAAPLATLIESTPGSRLTTPSGFISEGRDYGRGEYTLSGGPGGSAEFMLTNAVNVRLRGDTRMVMRNNMNVALTQGAAEFVVPTDATGFTVHLPGGDRVVDLGTRFRVRVDPDGRTSVVVTEGEVRLDESDSVSHAIVAGHGIARVPGQPWRIVDLDTQPGESILADYDLAESREPRFGFAPPLVANPALPVTTDGRGVSLDRPGQYLTLATNPLHKSNRDWMIRLAVTPRDIGARNAIVVHCGDPQRDGVGVMIHNGQWTLLAGGARLVPLAPVSIDRHADLAIVRADDTFAVYLDGSRIGGPLPVSAAHRAGNRLVLGGPTYRSDETFFGTIHSLRISEIEDTFDPTLLKPKPITPGDPSPVAPEPTPSLAPVTAEPE